MALAGPASNFCIVLVALLIMKIGIFCGVFTSPIYPDAEHLVVSETASWLYVAARFLSIAFYLNMILFLFNLFPVPPLDGWSVLKGVLPGALMSIHKEIGMNPILRWGGIIVAWLLFPKVGRPLLQFAERLIDI